jgi:hypothetical protein
VSEREREREREREPARDFLVIGQCTLSQRERERPRERQRERERDREPANDFLVIGQSLNGQRKEDSIFVSRMITLCLLRGRQRRVCGALKIF